MRKDCLTKCSTHVNECRVHVILILANETTVRSQNKKPLKIVLFAVCKKKKKNRVKKWKCRETTFD